MTAGQLLGGRPVLRVGAVGGDGRRVVLQLHGGGYRSGSPGPSRPLAAHLARRTGAEVLVPAYRLAPRHPFPAAVEDGLGAYTELLRDGVPADRIALVGESAGGGLALAVLLEAQRAGLPMPAAAVGLSPWLDLTLESGAFERCADSDPVLDRSSLRRSAALYLAGADARGPAASPLFADGAALAALPPVLLQAAREEVLVDDARRFGARMTAAGGRCRVELWEGATHCWQLFVDRLPKAVAAADSVADFLTEHLA
ncbi:MULTISPECIES: alpha/beta hydrolase [unclassified Streptomyces]|uniref:alpha/beta hydrolase n=1 Tax=unclassified Streptomyces TaxID=2593676 RepID=UPI0011E6C19C|nr:alpha/beta hydrolase [Streptomyces sp. sk2.1]TXS60162.1 alpha/beta hydrolase [Streptomyces sp. sk2.1]